MPIVSVTRRRHTGRGLFRPSSHAIIKAVGGTITASWNVKNSGGVSGFAFIEIFFPAPGSAFLGATESIAPGATVTLTLTGTITTLIPGTTYMAELRVRALSPATVGPGASHNFTVTISPTGLATITAIGDPSIN